MVSADGELSSIASGFGPPQSEQVSAQRKVTMDELRELSEYYSVEEEKLAEKKAELSSKREGLTQHIEEREQKVVGDLAGLQGELTTMTKMTEFSSAEGIGALNALIGEALATEDVLQSHVDTRIVPQSEYWRRGVGDTLEWFGLAIDYEKIMARADEAYQHEMQENSEVEGSRARAQQMLSSKLKFAEKAMAEERRALAREIGAVAKRTDLDAAQKMALIEQLRQESQAKEKLLMEKEQLMLQSEHASELSVEQQRELLATLVERAARARRLWANPPTHEELDAARADSKQEAKELKGSLVYGPSATSLLQAHDLTEDGAMEHDLSRARVEAGRSALGGVGDLTGRVFRAGESLARGLAHRAEDLFGLGPAGASSFLEQPQAEDARYLQDAARTAATGGAVEVASALHRMESTLHQEDAAWMKELEDLSRGPAPAK
jgi:hypothetical protein